MHRVHRAVLTRGRARFARRELIKHKRALALRKKTKLTCWRRLLIKLRLAKPEVVKFGEEDLDFLEGDSDDAVLAAYELAELARRREAEAKGIPYVPLPRPGTEPEEEEEGDGDDKSGSEEDDDGEEELYSSDDDVDHEQEEILRRRRLRCVVCGCVAVCVWLCVCGCV